MASQSSKVLRAIGWIELVVSAPLFYVLVRVTKELFWPMDPSPTHGEWLPLVAPIVGLLLVSFLLPGIAAVRPWPIHGGGRFWLRLG
jgi:hypothetical protein